MDAGEAPPKALAARMSQAYASNSRSAQEEQWILQCLPLVRHIAQKVASQLSRHADREELISAGTLGLVKAARAFDPSRDAEFKTYAYIRIRGAMIDELRGRSFVPPSVHNQIRSVQQAYTHFSTVNGRPPTDEELASEAGLTSQELYTALEEGRRQHFLYIHGFSEEQSMFSGLMPLDKAPSPDRQAERKELMENLASAITLLPARDRQIILLYYERDLTMKEVAAVLNVTESRVSQLHASALLKLSMKMKALAPSSSPAGED